MAARTMRCLGVRLGSTTLCVLVLLLLSSASSLSSHRKPHQPDSVQVSYFPNADNNFGFRAKLTDAELLQQELDVLKLKNDLGPSVDISGQWNNGLYHGDNLGVLQFRSKRAVTQARTTEQVPENKNGTLLDFGVKLPTLGTRRYSLNSTSAHPEMFELTSAGQLVLRQGFHLDYEVESMRTIDFVVHAASLSDPTDVYEITATLTVTNVDEPPVFETQPQPYLGTIRTSPGSSYTIITLVARDPEGAVVQYDKNSVSPNSYNDQIELVTQTINGVRQCQLRTLGSGNFEPVGQTISVTVTARDATSQVTSATVEVLVGVRPPQFFQSRYQGAMPEKNKPQQTVYKLGTSEELKVEWKTFQDGTVTLSLTGESGSYPNEFNVIKTGGNLAHITCKKELDYEEANPKTQSLTLKAVQRVGSVDLSSIVTLTVQIEDRNDNKPVFGQTQYQVTIPEDRQQGDSIMEVEARDADSALNGEVVYSLIGTTDFEIVTNPPTGTPPVYKGTIKVKGKLDFDRPQGPYYQFQVKATDKGTPAQTGTSNVLVNVTNVNDEAPHFLYSPGTQREVREDALVGSYVTQVIATDGDGDKVTFSFGNGQQTLERFRIDARTGVITLSEAIRSTDDRFNLTIRASDDGSCCPGQSRPTKNNETFIYVQVIGSNDERPDFKTCSSLQANVDENSPPGTSVVTVTAEDNDRGPNGDVTYSLLQSQSVFNINSSTGLITVKGNIDREANAFIQVTVNARDGGVPPEEGYCTFRVNVNDVNDNPPRFDKSRYEANITLGIAQDVPFAFVRAYDDDVGTNAEIIYSLPNNGEGKFAIIRENGFISLTSRLVDSDAGKSFSLTAMAKDAGSPVPLNSTVQVRVNVGNSNIKPPVWDKDYNNVTYSVSESASEGDVVIRDMRCNSQSSDDPRVEFQLVREDGSSAARTEFFSLVSNGTSVNILSRGKFDYAKQTEHVIRIRCLNFGSVTLITETNPKVLLIDTNNQIPEFLDLSGTGRYEASVQENKPVGTSVLTIEATDKDATELYRQISFSIVSGGDNFTISPGSKENTAVVKTNIVFDREIMNFYFLEIKAEDGAPSSLPALQGTGKHNSATRFMKVEILDVNDNPPYFEYALYNVTVDESTYISDLIDPPITVSDRDISDNGKHIYRIIGGNTNNPAFGIHNGKGQLFPLRKLDYEGTDKQFLLTVEASDGRYSATTMVNVTVRDENDNNPSFSQKHYYVRNITEEDGNLPKVLLWVEATDADVNRDNNIRYTLEGSGYDVSSFFNIDMVTGEITLKRKLDRDAPKGRSRYVFNVRAADELVNPNFGYATVTVLPKDINDNMPVFLDDPLQASVMESSPPSTSVIRINATDADEGVNGTIVYSITSIKDGAGVDRQGYFVINPTQGVVSTNTQPENLDRENQDTYSVTIQLQDQGTPPQQNSKVLTVTLSDANDQSPVFVQKVYKIEMSENQKAGEVIRVVAKDSDIGDNAKIVYLLVGTSNFFSVKPINNEGSVQVDNPVDYEDANQRFFNLTIEARDNVGHKDTCIVEITVLDFNDNAPVISPGVITGNVSEDAAPGTPITTFSARDDDITDINKAFEFSISRASDPRRHFSIDSRIGQVKVRRRLDRETQAVHILTILAIDKGSPPLTGTATLTVDVEDVNDNYPTFKEDYRPVVPENKQNVDLTVQVVLGKDPDASPYGAPFGFQLAPCTAPSCDSNQFGFSFDPDGAGKNGTATITTTNTNFDREEKKYYRIPIIMWDMRGSNSPLSLTGTNTLTVVIGDDNDQPMSPGTQNIFVYNYKGQFGPLEIGRVYVEDEDDWDLPDKTFNYTGPDWMNNYFTVDYNTGMITMKKGVPSSQPSMPYSFSVRVYDKKWNSVVSSTVVVTVEELTEEAVRNSGATRFKDTSAEEFIRVPKASGSNNANKPASSFQKFHALLADKLNTPKENVQIISVQDVEGGYTDVRYSVHGSPYYPSSQTDSIVALNKAEVENSLGLSIDEVPIDACTEEVFEGGCYNYMDITGKPALVNANGTSFVGVEVFIRAMEGCRALDFPEPNECSGDYCYHGGTCVKNDFGVLSCKDCPPGFDGPRCQQLRHSFSGQNYALYPTLEQCEDSETSIEFITTKGDGLLLYNGPATPPPADKPQDFISLELAGGLPVLNIDHGSGPATLSLDGRDKGGNQVLRSLADGKWHKIDIVRKGKFVELIVDDCKAAAASGSETQAPDTKPCRVSATSQGENSFLNVASLLQVGGRAPKHTYPAANVVRGAGFDGCVRNLIHNSKYYDLHYKETPSVPSGENGCPREDKVCERVSCGVHGTCTASLTPPQATCTCKPGWRGDTCATATTVRDLKKDSFILWRPKRTAQLPTYELDIQVMYRTWDMHGVLFTAATANSSMRVTLELKDGRLQALYNLDNQDNTLLLNNTNASDGYWHVARFRRVMHVATLTLDQGEGRNHASLRDAHSNVHMRLTSQSPMYGGAIVTSPSGAQVVDRDLTDTCIQDVRVNGEYVPINRGENSVATVVEYVNEQSVQDGCTRSDGCVVSPPVCPANSICVDLWGRGVCRCASGYHDTTSGVCQSACEPENPCFLDVPCSVENGTQICTCTLKPWYGPMCNLYPAERQEPSVGVSGAAIAAIVVSILVAILLVLVVIFLVTWYMRRKEKDDFDRFVVEDDADFDIRENVMFYDEEGAAEEDQNAFDLTKLPMPSSETMGPPTDMVPRSRELPRGRRVPDDRPDVGDVLHDRMRDADDDPDAPPHDTLITFNEEGAGSDAGSLSSLGSSSSDASQDYDYLNDWGPKFAKLADMYGAGQE